MNAHVQALHRIKKLTGSSQLQGTIVGNIMFLVDTALAEPDHTKLLIDTVRDYERDLAAGTDRARLKAVRAVLNKVDPQPPTLDEALEILSKIKSNGSVFTDTLRREVGELLDRVPRKEPYKLPQQPVALSLPAPTQQGYSMRKTDVDMYIQFLNAGWTYEQMVQHGYLK